MIHSPSKHTSIDRLEQIRRDNYLGVKKEYSAEETDSLLWEKYQRKADQADPLDFCAVDEIKQTGIIRTVVLPPYPKQKTWIDSLGELIRQEGLERGFV